MKTFTLLLLPLVASLAGAQEINLQTRFGYEKNTKDYPQKNPQETLKSIVKAYDLQRLDYLLAHLADPLFIDSRVEFYKKNTKLGTDLARGILAFDRVVGEIDQHFLEDASLMRELHAIAKDGDWEIDADTAVGTTPQLQGRAVYMRKVQDAWFLENRQRKR